MNIQSLSEKVPIDETIKSIEYIRNERDVENVKSYVGEIMPFGKTTKIKYRNKFMKRFLEIEGDIVIYSPLIKFINDIESYQTKKEVIYFIVCITTDSISKVIKAFYVGDIPPEVDEIYFEEIISSAMPKAKLSSVKKTYSVVTTILKDFDIIKEKKGYNRKKKIFCLNENLRPTYEGVLFTLYYEFIKLKGNKMPEVEIVLESDTFKYFLMGDLMKKRYLKWMLDNGYIENYVMGGNNKYQFSIDNLEDLIKKVINND